MLINVRTLLPQSIGLDPSLDILQLFLTFLAAIVASSGFWLFITRKTETKNNQNRLLMGLAHDRIMYLGVAYIDRGWITQDEYENLHEYLYEPYKAMGGNGSAERVMVDVNKLPLRKTRFARNEVNANDD